MPMTAKPLSLEEATLDEIRDLIDSSPVVRAELYHIGHQSLELRSPEHRGYRFRALNRVFSMRALRVGRKTYHGVYEIMAEGALATRPVNDPEGRGYRYGTGTIAYLTRHRLLSASNLHEAIAAPVADRIKPGCLIDKLPRGQGRIVLEAPRTLQLASLHHRCRDVLGYPRPVYTQIIGARSQHTLKNWEFGRARIPAAVWPELIKLLRLLNTDKANAAIVEIEKLALGIAPSLRPTNPRPHSTATPIPIEEVRAAGKAAEQHIFGNTTSRYMRGYQDEQKNNLKAEKNGE